MTPIVLERADFFELYTLALKLELAKQAMETARAAVVAKATQHGVERGQPFVLDDATCSIIVGERPPS